MDEIDGEEVFLDEETMEAMNLEEMMEEDIEEDLPDEDDEEDQIKIKLPTATIHYSIPHGQMYVYLSDQRKVDRTECFGDKVLVDYSADGNVMGVEILT